MKKCLLGMTSIFVVTNVISRISDPKTWPGEGNSPSSYFMLSSLKLILLMNKKHCLQYIPEMICQPKCVGSSTGLSNKG